MCPEGCGHMLIDHSRAIGCLALVLVQRISIAGATRSNYMAQEMCPCDYKPDSVRP
jgi:hypothetical protein